MASLPIVYSIRGAIVPSVKGLLIAVLLMCLGAACSPPEPTPTPTPEPTATPTIPEWKPGTTAEEARELCESRIVARMATLGRPFETGAAAFTKEWFIASDEEGLGESFLEGELPLGVTPKLYETYVTGALLGCWAAPVSREPSQLDFLRAPALVIPEWNLGTTAEEARELCESRLVVRIEAIGGTKVKREAADLAKLFCGFGDGLGEAVGDGLVELPKGISHELYWVWIGGLLVGSWTGPIN